MIKLWKRYRFIMTLKKYSKRTEEIIITGLFGTSGTNNDFVDIKDSGLQSISYIIKILEYVIIKLTNELIQEQ